MSLEVIEIRASGALQIAAPLAQRADVEQCSVELRIERQRAREPRFGVGGAPEAIERDGVVIRGVGARQGLRVVAFQEERESAQILDLGRRRAGSLRAFELMQRRVVLPVEDVVDGAIAGGLRGEEKQSEDQAAPRTRS